MDWARNRGEDSPFDRWHDVAEEIIEQFPITHPVAAISALVALDLDGVTDVARKHQRYPDRAHYVEHALALCADRRHPVPVGVLYDILERARRVGLRVLEAQALRLRGMQTDNTGDLAAALDAFDAMGARRYGARVPVELASLASDADALEMRLGQMREFGEGDLLQR